MFLDKTSRLFALSTCLELTIDDFPIVNVFVSDDHGVSDPFSIHLKDRDNLADEGLHLHFISRPHLARNAVPHGIFHAQKPWKKVG